MAEYNDPIRRACERNLVKAGSPLERTVRKHAFKFFAPDGSVLDERIDSFIASERNDPFYKESFAGAPPAKAAGLKINISEAERIAIDRGTLVIEAADNQETASIGPGTVQATEDEFKEIIASGKIRVG
jgi:hypothetical protein